MRVLYAIVLLPILAALTAALVVGYLLWGTSRSYNQSQELLRDAFDAGNTEQPVARIVSDAIGLDAYVMAGVSNQALTDGPGRYPSSAAPGQLGNIAIAGRRATFGAPFARIDELEFGDEIRLETTEDVFSYVVGDTRRNRDSPSLIVSPSTTGILSDNGGSQLTLVAVHPRFSTRQRLVVFAELDPDDANRTDPASALPVALPDDTMVGLTADAYDWAAMAPGLGVAAAAWVAIWLIGRPRRETIGYIILALVIVGSGTIWAASIAAQSLAPY